MLRLLCYFLLDAGLGESMIAVFDGERNGFRRDLKAPADFQTWLTHSDLGSLNHLLHATNKELTGPASSLPYLNPSEELWSKRVFGPLSGLSGAASKLIHAGVGQAPVDADHPSAKALFKSAFKVLEHLDDDAPAIRLPTPVQLYREYQDGHGRHYEGYARVSGEVTKVTFFEVEETLDLHETYLYLAATNPSAVDAAFCPIRPEMMSGLPG